MSLKKIEKARSERRKQVKVGLSTHAAVVELFIGVHQHATLHFSKTADIIVL